MPIGKILGIPIAFASGMFIIIFITYFSLSNTEISRGANVSDTLHQAIENIALDELLNGLDTDKKKDFIAVISNTAVVEENIRDKIEQYMKAFPDVCINYTASSKNSASLTNGVISGENLNPLVIEIHAGDYTTTSDADGYKRYIQTEQQLPWIKIYTQGSKVDGKDAVTGFYIPAVKQLDGKEILPLRFQVSVETKHTMFGDDADTRGKFGTTGNISEDGKLNGNLNTNGTNVEFDANKATGLSPSQGATNADGTWKIEGASNGWNQTVLPGESDFGFGESLN